MAEINVGQISEALNNKADLDLNNTNPFADYVIEWKAPTSSDQSWYRLYKSGWIEQGGHVDLNVSSVNLPISMSDDDYFTIINYCKSSSTQTVAVSYVNAKTQTTANFTIEPSSIDRIWEVKGFAAQS